jgi:predicted phosphodiesterase
LDTKKLHQATLICDRYKEQVPFKTTLASKIPKVTGGKLVRMVAISDLHVPFFRDDLLKEVVSRTEGFDYCVVNGDLLDAYSLSTFKKTIEIPFVAEYTAGALIVEFLAEHYKKVILVGGNHDVGRWGRLLDKVETPMKFLLTEHPLSLIAKGIRFTPEGIPIEDSKVKNVTFSKNLWWARVGQTIFVHRLRGHKKGPLGNSSVAADHFIHRGTSFQCLVSGHSHKGGVAPYRGKILIDQGCLCLPLEYESSGNCTLSPPDLGYAVITSDKSGNIKLDETNFVYLGTYQDTA